VLLDLDGVLHVGDRVVEGAVEAIERIRAAGIVKRFITNTSTLSRATLLNRLGRLGLDIPSDELFAAPQATAAYLREQTAIGSVHLLLADDVKQDFAEFHQVPLAVADCIVAGDIGDAWSCDLLNQVFNRLVAGARLIVIHKNRFWQTEQGLRMDLGGFVAALEYCSGVQAVVMGKPSAAFFKAALNDMGLASEATAIVGDDIYSDVQGGQQAGLTGVLVRTGKYRQSHVESTGVHPDRVIDSIADLPRLLGLNQR
jgi:HAD superfamily hydrolase (TIGR01458 family)